MEYARILINEKDAPILAAAITGQVEWLLSLDKHFLMADLQGKGWMVRKPPELMQ